MFQLRALGLWHLKQLSRAGNDAFIDGVHGAFFADLDTLNKDIEVAELDGVICADYFEALHKNAMDLGMETAPQGGSVKGQPPFDGIVFVVDSGLDGLDEGLAALEAAEPDFQEVSDHRRLARLYRSRGALYHWLTFLLVQDQDSSTNNNSNKDQRRQQRIGWKFGRWHDVGYWQIMFEGDAPKRLFAVDEVLS